MKVSFEKLQPCLPGAKGKRAMLAGCGPALGSSLLGGRRPAALGEEETQQLWVRLQGPGGLSLPSSCLCCPWRLTLGVFIDAGGVKNGRSAGWPFSDLDVHKNPPRSRSKADSHSAGLGRGWGARVCIPDQLPGEARVAQCPGSSAFVAQTAGRTTDGPPADTQCSVCPLHLGLWHLLNVPLPSLTSSRMPSLIVPISL